MADFSKLVAQTEQRLGQYSARLFRIEAHLRREERRAAQAQLAGFIEELDEFSRSFELPFQMMLAGAQIGLLAGKGSFLRGRLPAALVCGVGGWMAGHSVLARFHTHIDELRDRAYRLQTKLQEPATA